MTETFTILTSGLTLITAVVGFWTVLLRQQQLRHAMNSRLDELIALTRQTAHAEGVAAGIEQEKERAAAAERAEDCPT